MKVSISGSNLAIEPLFLYDLTIFDNFYSVTYTCFSNFDLDGEEPIPKTKKEQISELEDKLKSMKAREYVTSTQCVGRGDTLEVFPMKHLNIKRNAELMACPRRPPKK